MAETDLFNRHRLLLCYKGDISALVLFAQQADGNICFPSALPPLSAALENDGIPVEKICLHPSALVNAINQLYQFEKDLLHIESQFRVSIDAPGGLITVHLARFMVLDPPHRLLQGCNCQLKTLPQLRGRPPAEMELLRRAYVQMMES